VYCENPYIAACLILTTRKAIFSLYCFIEKIKVIGLVYNERVVALIFVKVVHLFLAIQVVINNYLSFDDVNFDRWPDIRRKIAIQTV
jgi:hypothetical protein